MEDQHTALSLLCRVGARLCALPLEHVVETMRPLPIEPIAGAPHFVRGLSIIRGAPVPVVDAARLLDAGEATLARLVTLKTDNRQVALGVDDVLGVRSIPVASLQELPPLLHEASADVVSTIGRLDAELLLVLRSAKLTDEDGWAERHGQGTTA